MTLDIPDRNIESFEEREQPYEFCVTERAVIPAAMLRQRALRMQMSRDMESEHGDGDEN